MGPFRDNPPAGIRSWLTGRLFLVLVGLFIFLTAAIYLRTGQESIDRSYRVVGSRVQLPGRAAFRVVGFVDRETKEIPLEITGAVLQTSQGELPLDIVATGGRGPVDIVVDLPQQNDSAVMALYVAGKAGVRTLHVPLQWGTSEDLRWDVMPDEERSSVLEGEFRVDVVPVGGVLVSSVENTLLVRVRDTEGRAVAGAQVSLQPGNRKETIVGVTDGAGLWSLEIPPGPGALSVHLAIKTKDGKTSQHERLIPITYSKTRLVPAGAIVDSPNTSSTIQIRSFNESGTVFCDAWEGQVLRHSWSLPLSDGQVNLPLAPAALSNRFSLQCYYHVSDPGTIPARGIVLRGAAGDTGPARMIFDEAGVEVDYLRSLPPDTSFSAAERDRLLSWFFSTLKIPVVVPTLLLDTLQLDKQLLQERTAKIRRWLLWTMILLFLALGVWMTTVIVMGQKQLKKSYDVYRAENPDVEGELNAASFSRTDGRMPLWVIGAIIAANVIALLLLLMLVVGDR